MKPYAIAPADADFLRVVSVMPAAERAADLREYAASLGADALADLFAEFVGLSLSVVANQRAMIELLGITEADMHPHTAERINLPSIEGALAGVRLAASIDGGRLCEGCAYRLGSIANQCEPTVKDAVWARTERRRFNCHEDERTDRDGAPKRMCGGHAQALRRERRAAR